MPKPKRQPEPEKVSDERVVIIHLKGSSEYAEWLDKRHEETHIPKSTLYRLAMAEYAAARGWPPPPTI